MDLPRWADEPRHRWTADDVQKMVAAGILNEDDRVELLEGELVEMSPQTKEHWYAKALVLEALREGYGTTAWVVGQDPIQVADDNQPEPDIAVLRGSIQSYRGRLPRPSDALLLVEIAHTSRKRDLQKASIYAAAGVPVYWILDVAERQLQVHTDPGPNGYRVVNLLREDTTVSPPGLDLRWVIAELLP